MYYLNVDRPIERFARIAGNPLYVDKSLLIDKIASSLENGLGHDICITRPRRFGKTVNADMLASYYCKEYNTKDIFDQLKISQCDSYLKNLNQYNVVYMNMASMPRNCQSYNEYITYIENNLISDLKTQYSINLSSEYPLSEYFYQTKDCFVFILDEL